MADPSNPPQPRPKNDDADSSTERTGTVSDETAEKALNKIEEVRRKLEPRG